MTTELADEITYRLIGYSVSFQYFGETIYIDPYVSVTLSGSVQRSSGNNSYFKIDYNPFNLFPTISFSIFDINPRARELGMKLLPIIEYGEIFVNTSLNSLRITVNVFKAKFIKCYNKFSVTITLFIPPRSNRQERISLGEDGKNVQKAFTMGALAVGGFLLFKLIKGGIGAVLGGPVGAAVGFAT